MEQERSDSAELDAGNATFWGEMEDSLLDAQEMIAESAREHGVDLDELMADAEAEPTRREPSEAHRSLFGQAQGYGDRAHSWLKLNQERLDRKKSELLSGAPAGESGADAARHVADINNALDVIRWYLWQIGIKLQRAAQGGLDLEEEDDRDLVEADVAERDGSAKVALIGIDRSIAAWGRLYQYLLEAHEEILEILLHLNRLRRGVEHAFPNARTFIRPGLDDA